MQDEAKEQLRHEGSLCSHKAFPTYASLSMWSWRARAPALFRPVYLGQMLPLANLASPAFLPEQLRLRLSGGEASGISLKESSPEEAPAGLAADRLTH
jgi:hypothetical protein